jgi:hypothetical protein
VNLDAANVMLAAGYASSSKTVEPGQLAAALMAFSEVVASAPRLPAFNDQGQAKAAFDQLAPASIKAQVGL